MKIVYEAKRIAPCTDGIRRSRCAVVRNTRQILLDSTIKDFLGLFPEGQAGEYYRTELKFLLKFDDVECEVLFRGLDDSADVRRLLSLNLSFAMLDEVREINPDVFNALTGRLGRYPNSMLVPHRPEWGNDDEGNPINGCVDDNGREMKKLWGATNPPDIDSFWEKYLTEYDKEKVFVTIQPSGRSPEADWKQYLPAAYYDDLMVGKTEDWISVYVDGKWGKSLSGQPVFRCFDRDTHLAKEALKSVSSSLVIGVDAGLNPTAVITDQTYDGRVLVLDAVTGLDGGMGALRFCREILKPLLYRKYPNKSVAIIIDPAAFQRGQTDEKSVADIFKNEGFAVKPALTNNISARIAAVEKYLTMTVNGNAGLLIDKENCDGLVKALGGKYMYKINNKGDVDNTPLKNHPASDYADSLEYACLHHDKGSIFGRQLTVAYSTPQNVSMAAWT